MAKNEKMINFETEQNFKDILRNKYLSPKLNFNFVVFS